MDWIPFLGAVGFGAIVTKVLDVIWLQRTAQRIEQIRWLRDQRLKTYSALCKEVLCEGLWRGQSTERDVLQLQAEAILLTDDQNLLALIEGYARDVLSTRHRIDQFINNGTSTIEERTEMRAREEHRLRQNNGLLAAAMRASLLADK